MKKRHKRVNFIPFSIKGQRYFIYHQSTLFYLIFLTKWKEYFTFVTSNDNKVNLAELFFKKNIWNIVILVKWPGCYLSVIDYKWHTLQNLAESLL
jgi:hypothetical protein